MVKGSSAKTGPRGAKSRPAEKPGEQDVDVVPHSKKLDPHALVEKAYKKLDTMLEKQPAKAIDDLLKLMKLEKDLDGEDNVVKEVRVRWETSKDESSSGE